MSSYSSISVVIPTLNAASVLGQGKSRKHSLIKRLPLDRGGVIGFLWFDRRRRVGYCYFGKEAEVPTK